MAGADAGFDAGTVAGAAGGLFGNGCHLAHAVGVALRMEGHHHMSDLAHGTGPDPGLGRGLGLVPVLGLGRAARERLRNPGLAGCRREQQQQQQRRRPQWSREDTDKRSGQTAGGDLH